MAKKKTIFLRGKGGKSRAGSQSEQRIRFALPLADSAKEWNKILKDSGRCAVMTSPRGLFTEIK